MGPNESDNTTPPVEPEQQPVVTQEESAQAPVSEAPVETDAFSNTTTPTPQLPVKKSKKGLIIGLVSAGVVVLGLVGAGVAYAFVYNSPDNAVVDAFSKMIAAKSGSVTGSATIKTQDTSIKLDISSLSNESKLTSLDANMVLTASGKDYKLKGHFAGSKDEFYVKFDDLRSVITGALGEEYSSVIDTYYGSLLNKIDGKWVVVKQSDIDSLTSGSVSNKESQCVQDEMAKMQTDPTLRNEVTEVYKKNPLFTIESKGSDSDGNRYKLVPVSNEKAKNFMKAMVETKFVKALDDCTSSDLKKSLTDGSDETTSSDKATGSLEIWVDGWSHSLNKISLNVKDESTEVTSEFKIKYNNPAVTLPKGETTVDDLKTEIESLQEQFSATSTSVYSDDSGYDYSY